MKVFGINWKKNITSWDREQNLIKLKDFVEPIAKRLMVCELTPP